MNLELDKKIAEKIMGLEVVGECAAWDPDGGGWMIFRPEENINGRYETKLCFVRSCNCEENFPHKMEPLGDTTLDLKLYEEWNKELQEEFTKEKAVWGHSKHCLDVAEDYSENIQAAHKVVEKIIGKDYSFDLGYHPHNTAPWVALFAKYPANIEFNTGRGYSNTAAMAICLAALDTIRER